MSLRSEAHVQHVEVEEGIFPERVDQFESWKRLGRDVGSEQCKLSDGREAQRKRQVGIVRLSQAVNHCMPRIDDLRIPLSIAAYVRLCPADQVGTP